MGTFVAHYVSPSGSSARAKGTFEFESDARAGSKALAHDARLKLLELFGADAVAWSIDRIERKRSRACEAPGQMELDFRAPKRVRKAKKGYW